MGRDRYGACGNSRAHCRYVASSPLLSIMTSPAESDWIRLLQRHLLPFESSHEIEQRLRGDTSSQLLSVSRLSGVERNECLHKLWSTSPVFFVAREQRSAQR